MNETQQTPDPVGTPAKRNWRDRFRRVEVLSLSRIAAMKDRTKKQRRRKEKAQRRLEARLEAKGATLVSRQVTA